jgi:hypothetical protein
MFTHYNPNRISFYVGENLPNMPLEAEEGDLLATRELETWQWRDGEWVAIPWKEFDGVAGAHLQMRSVTLSDQHAAQVAQVLRDRQERGQPYGPGGLPGLVGTRQLEFPDGSSLHVTEWEPGEFSAGVTAPWRSGEKILRGSSEAVVSLREILAAVPWGEVEERVSARED